MIKINYSSLLIISILIGFFIYSNCQQPGLCRKRNKSNKGLFEHEEYCDYYWRCDSRKSEPYLQACPNGLAFAGAGRGLYEYCSYPHTLKNCDENRYQAQEPVSSENCPYSYGIFPHKTSCSKYWQCWNNTASEQKCGFQLLYNEELASCDYPSNVKGCQKHPICKEVPNGPVLLKGSCILYWQCVGGYPRLERCPAGLAVDPKTLKCELATKVEGCGDKVTTPKYEETEEHTNEKKKKEIVARVVAAAKESKNQKELKKEGKAQNQKPNKVPKENKIVKESKNQNKKEAKSQKAAKSQNQKEAKSQNQKEAKIQSQKESKNQEVPSVKQVKKKKKKRQQKQS